MLSELDDPHFFLERAWEVHRRAETIRYDSARESLLALAKIDRRRNCKSFTGFDHRENTEIEGKQRWEF